MDAVTATEQITADTPEDFAHVAGLLRRRSAKCGQDKLVRAVLSNNFNLILAALDIAAATVLDDQQSAAEPARDRRDDPLMARVGGPQGSF